MLPATVDPSRAPEGPCRSADGDASPDRAFPADPINVGLIGDAKDILCDACGGLVSGRSDHAEIVDRDRRQRAARSPLQRTRRSAISIISAGARTLLSKSRSAASADRRNHVRFWKVLDQGEEKRPVWLVRRRWIAASAPQPLHRRGHPPHRPRIIDALNAACSRPISRTPGMVTAKYQVTGIGPTMDGRNGGGDPHYTDGEVWLLRLVEACQRRERPCGHASCRARCRNRDQGPDLACRSPNHREIAPPTRCNSAECTARSPWKSAASCQQAIQNKETHNDRPARAGNFWPSPDPPRCPTRCCRRCTVRRSTSIPTRWSN